MYNRCLAATRICALASLLFLFKVNTATDNDDYRFFDQDNHAAINECFLTVTKKNAARLPPIFRLWIEQNNIELPERCGMANSFKYLVEQYTQNVRTNLRRWAYKRVRTFLRLKQFILNVRYEMGITDRDVRNAMAAVFVHKDGTNDNEETIRMNYLLDELVDVGGHGSLDMCQLMNDDNWFKSLPMFVKIQRTIYDFNLTWNQRQQPNILQRPKLNNFKAVPICDFKLKHIKIDNEDLMRIAKLKQFSIDREKGIDDWHHIFNMEKMEAIGKRHKQFHSFIVTDSVSASVLYKKKTVPPTDQTEQILRDLQMGLIIYELGIDPGLKTWNATVRRTVPPRTNKEVCYCLFELYAQLFSYVFVFSSTNFHMKCNIVISSKRFNFKAQTGVRFRKMKRLTRDFTAFEQADREKYADHAIPTPACRLKWHRYVFHRLTVFNNGLEVYTKRNYARFGLDKYIRSTRAADKTARQLTNNQKSIIYMGAAEISPNSPIRIRKHVRCPGVRKLIRSFKKLGNCYIR